MSLNQSRSDNNSQYRKPVGAPRSASTTTSGHHRSFTGGRGRGAPTPTPSRSSKKVYDAHASHSRPIPATTLISPPPHPPPHALPPGGVPPAGNAKPSENSVPPLPRPPSSSTNNSDSTLPSTPLKGSGAKEFSLQFGSISPSFMNGMQVPARTSSAPPNLDEQKRQAHYGSLRAVPEVPLPCGGPKQESSQKDATAFVEKHVTQKINAEPQASRHVQVLSASPPTQAQKTSVLPTTGIPRPAPFHQPSASMQYGGPNPQNQSQGVPTSSLQLQLQQMPLHNMGNPSQVQQQVFVTGLPHPIMQTRGIMHQGQNMGYNPQLATQVPHQIRNVGMNIPSQLSQQPVGNFARTRKTVKITHPDTHEELTLDSVPTQSQPVPNYTANPMGYYSTGFTAGPPMYPVPSSLPVTSVQSNASTQGSRFNYTVSQTHSTISYTNQSSNAFSVKNGATKHDPSNTDRNQNVQSMLPLAKPSSTPVTIKAPTEKAGCSSAAGKVEPPPILESDGTIKDEDERLQSKSVIGHVNQTTLAPASVPPDTSLTDIASVPNCVDLINNANEVTSTSIGDIQKQPSKKENALTYQQVDGNDDSESLNDLNDSSKTDTLDTSKARIVPTSSGEGISETVALVPSDASSVKASVNSSLSSDSCESQNVIENSCNQHDLQLQEVITSESSITQEKGEEKCPQVLLSDHSLKASHVIDGVDQHNKVENMEKAGAVPGTIDASKNVADYGYVENKLSDACDNLASNSSSSLLKSPNLGEYNVSNSSVLDNEAVHFSDNIMESTSGHEAEIVQNLRPSSSSDSISGSSKASLESSKTKNRGKKKLKELLQKADALGTTADLYVAYKGPEDKKESALASELAVEDNTQDMHVGIDTEKSMQESKDELIKAELDDWEDADISSPKLESYSKEVLEEEGVAAKKYSRDFLLTFSDHCVDLPTGFKITSDVADALMRISVSTPQSDREYPSSGRVVDRPGGAARLDRRGSGTMDTDRWNKHPTHLPQFQDPRMDLAYGSNILGFEGGRGPYGVVRNLRPQGLVQHSGGILSGPMHTLGFQGVQRNNSDADRWQRASNFNKGLMPAPYAPAPVMHRAERKYEVGKVTDEEQAKQRKLKGILNKLTPQNFERLFEQVKEVNIDNVITLTGVISQIFDKALTEPTFCEMYANFCQHLASELPDLSVDNEKITFRRLLLNKCQEEFERGEREEQEANNVDGEGDTEQSEKVREEKRIKARRRMLGNIRLIGELFKKRMLTERIMHGCINKLLGQYQNPDEENIEALCKLMSTIGEMIDQPKAKEHMDAYFDIMGQLSNNMKLSSRVRFMLRDAIDLRKNKWQQRRKVEGPKKIEEVHRDAAQERQGQVSRSNRGLSMNTSMRRGEPPEFGPRGSMVPSPIGPGISYRVMPPQGRGFGGQDMRIDERNTFDSRAMLPPQRLSSDKPITLGPQGGLGRGLTYRAQSSVSSSPFLDSSPSLGDPRRMAGNLNGFGTVPERGGYSTRDDHFIRNTTDRFGASVAYDHSGSQERNSYSTSREVRYPDQNVDRPRPSTPPVLRAEKTVPQDTCSDEQLHDLSLAAIKEYYSAKDEAEVALCIKDLNAPNFYPTVVSIWVIDSFERKNLERDLLAGLLVSLTKPKDGTFSPSQLYEGFKSVLTNLEDTVTDAPKAPEFLGHILAKVVLENVLPLKDVGWLIQNGGEEPGRLREVGLAAEVLGSLLEMIKSEKGETTLKEIRASSNLELRDFRPPHPIRCHKLDMFM